MEYTWKTLRTLLGVVVFFACCALVVIGQKNIGYEGLALMLAGIAGIVLCLWGYNKTHR